MELNEYQQLAQKTAIYQNKLYPIASLGAEAQEFADLFYKPWLRGDNDGQAPERDKVISEAGDVLWNLANALADAGITLNEVAVYNIQKVTDRAARGVIKGSGGDR